jgi:stage II sporulation protein AA (anti-sigma F factor antagonist)
MDIDIDRRPGETGVVLAVRGRLDADSAGELRHAVAAEVRQGVHVITLDLVETSFLSSAGIRVLFETQREARAAGGDCHIGVASPSVRKVLELTRLDGILMRPTGVTAATADAGPAPTPGAAAPRDLLAHGVRLSAFEPPPAAAITCQLHGPADALGGAPHGGVRLRLPADTFGIGIAALADDGPPETTAGEWLAACGAAYQRPPRAFAAVDYVLGTNAFVPEADVVSGLSWAGVPRGRAAFEPADDAPDVAIDDLAAALLDATTADGLVLVVVGEIHGLVAAELIRPLAEATPDDHPLIGARELTARWLCFSREPVHAGRTAVVVGVVMRRPTGPLAGLVAPLGPAGVHGHLHAVVFPQRAPRRAARELAAVVGELAAAEPVAVVHLMADERPVLGDGRSSLVRGACWFAPLGPGGVA